MTLSLPALAERDLLAALPATTAATIRDWEMQGFDLDQIGQLLTDRPQLLGPKAGGDVPPAFWPQVKEQVRLLFCTDDPRYADVRDSLGKEGHATIGVVLSSISTALGTYFGGLEIGLVMPLVVVSLMTMSRISKEAWCAQQSAARAEPSAP